MTYSYDETERLKLLVLARKLLTLAKCPDDRCIDGAIPYKANDIEWNAEQCQWCYERNKVVGPRT